MDAFYNFDALEQILTQLKKRLDEEKDKEIDWVECVNAYPEYTVEAEQIIPHSYLFEAEVQDRYH